MDLFELTIKLLDKNCMFSVDASASHRLVLLAVALLFVLGVTSVRQEFGSSRSCV
jgi:hypothetical protein